MGSILVITPIPIVRIGLRALLCGKVGEHAVYEAGSVGEALACAANDLVLIILDPEMPDINLPEFVHQLRQQLRVRHTPILLFGGRSPAMFASMAIKLGADGYLGRLSNEKTIAAAVHTLLSGMQCFPRQKGVDVLSDKMQALSPKEMAVLLLLRQGMRNKEVACRLFLSEKTISTHKRNMLRKLEISVISEINEHDMVMSGLSQLHAINCRTPNSSGTREHVLMALKTS